MARSIMIQGTMSNVGKSLITAGLCRVFAADGFRTAPFKSQNMALNSYITHDGLEMGRAQVVQAEAAGLSPDVRMNPILLKPTSDIGSQVIVMGKAIGNMKAMEYYRRKKEYIPLIREAYQSLASENDIIVIEGAGSPVEINLKENDIVNMGMAAIADAPVLLVGDIDRGGVFAQLLGTLELLEADERERVKGLIVNKFRGDAGILAPGIGMMEDRCGVKVLGVVPYTDIIIDDEDSLSEDLAVSKMTQKPDTIIDIAVIRLKRVSNYTDINALKTEPDVSIRFVDSRERLGSPDMVIIPGSKSTVEEMSFLAESGLAKAIKELADKGTLIFGICGGYQLMGNGIRDEAGAEGGGATEGLKLLPVDTVFVSDKITRQITGVLGELPDPFKCLSKVPVSGYEIHMGRTSSSGMGDDIITVSGNCMGTYLHGIFDDAEFRGALLSLLYSRKGLVRKEVSSVSYREYREYQYDKLADTIRDNIDMDKIYDIMGMGR